MLGKKSVSPSLKAKQEALIMAWGARYMSPEIGVVQKLGRDSHLKSLKQVRRTCWAEQRQQWEQLPLENLPGNGQAFSTSQMRSLCQKSRLEVF